MQGTFSKEIKFPCGEDKCQGGSNSSNIDHNFEVNRIAAAFYYSEEIKLNREGRSMSIINTYEGRCLPYTAVKKF
ncbi:hypothetical protein GCM10007874_58710 [Labrys miyagiensis]|uniref:Uncharacterized protein n=1 Tax=Labrys miyagiensis TaxID=346912 RepID=A0ABQ6CXA1_9HYPH|nr:hypothetical protein GCM10007874_58710 [Labrys miyagiensis]